MSQSQMLGENLLLQSHPMKLMGMQMGRNVTAIRLDSGKSIIHSTAKFSTEERSEIQNWGNPSWLVDATNFHDTLVEDGKAAFPDLPYFVPEGFPSRFQKSLSSLTETPKEWEGEVAVIRLDGMPKINEYVFVHHASRTLIVADLIFNLPPDTDAWTRSGLKLLSGIKQHPGCSRLFRMMIKNREAFEESLRHIFQHDFENVVVGHGAPIQSNGKEILRDVLSKAGFHI